MANLLTPIRRKPFTSRHRALLPFLLLSVLLHLLTVTLVRDWRQRVIDVRVFEARLTQIARFEPRRLMAERPVTSPKTEMEYRPVQSPASPLDQAVQLEAPPPLEAVPEPVIAIRPIDVATRQDTFVSEPDDDVQRAMAQIEASRDAERQESLDLMRVQDLAQGHERAIVLVDPNNRRNITGFLNITRLHLHGAGGGPLISLNGQPPQAGTGLEGLARFIRDHTDLLMQVRDQPFLSVRDPRLMDDPVHFLIEGAGQPLIGDWPLLQLTSVERTFLESYMRQGGLIFFEGTSRFLSQAVDLLQELFGADAGIGPIPVEHPIYHSFYAFPSGFPGEEKRQWEYLAQLPPSWDYPTRQAADVATATEAALAGGPANLDPNQANEADLNALGLWGVSLGDTLVAVISDLDLHTRWFGSLSNDPDVVINSAPALYTGINLIIHALTKKGSPAKTRALPAWRKTRPMVATTRPVDSIVAAANDQVDPGLYDELDASIAIVRAPLGSSLGAGGVTVRVDGRQRIDLLNGARNGLLLHNLTPGEHWIELEYSGQVEGLSVVLRGGLVATVTFAVSRLAMLKSVRLEVQKTQVAASSWRTTFSDLDMEEVSLEEDDSFPMPP